jgi:hypothetical protein
VHAVHPEHGVIFLTAGKLRSLMSYDMDKKKVRFIWTLGESNLSVHPYVPCFSDWLFFFSRKDSESCAVNFISRKKENKGRPSFLSGNQAKNHKHHRLDKVLKHHPQLQYSRRPASHSALSDWLSDGH